jgi:hypothetical protein
LQLLPLLPQWHPPTASNSPNINNNNKTISPINNHSLTAICRYAPISNLKETHAAFMSVDCRPTPQMIAFAFFSNNLDLLKKLPSCVMAQLENLAVLVSSPSVLSNPISSAFLLSIVPCLSMGSCLMDENYAFLVLLLNLK